MTNAPDSNNDNQWNDYWNNDGAEGEVFVSSSGSAHPEIAQWWQSHFAVLNTSCDLVDLACGAGSVFAHLPDHHDHRLFGADISAEALALMRKRVPGVTTTTCSADSLPYQSGQFDVVCSQFGVEYAGVPAFEEAARVLKPKGQLLILCHIEDGYIDARNRIHLEHARAILSSNFVPKALNLTQATFEAGQTNLDQATQDFAPAEKALSAACKTLAEGIHFHLYTGFRQLYERRAQYDQDDIVNWLTQMLTDVEHNVLRLEHMRHAANNKETMDGVAERFKVLGCSDVACIPMTLSKHQLPIAWALTATR